MRKRVQAVMTFDIEIDETKFTPEFFAQFDAVISPFGDDLNEHFEHLAQLFARGVVTGDSFIEGYGPASEMGIRFISPLGQADDSQCDVEIVESDPEPHPSEREAHAAWLQRHPSSATAAGG